MSEYQWIDDKIYWLTAVLKVDYDLFKANRLLSKELYSSLDFASTEKAKVVIARICSNFRIAPPIVEYDHGYEIDNDQNTAGHLNFGRIVIGFQNLESRYHLAAVLIHELMHYLLIYRNNISLPDKNENEKLTDLAAIVVGFGDWIINAKSLNNYKTGISHSMGYLNNNEVRYAYKKIMSLRKDSDTSSLRLEAVSILEPRATADTHIDIIVLLEPFFSKISTTVFNFFKYFFKILTQTAKEKDCPFCKRSIPAQSDKCRFCNRVIKENL